MLSPLVAAALEFFDALHRPRAQRGRVASNREFASALDLRHPPIERGNELAKLSEHVGRGYGHRRAPRIGNEPGFFNGGSVGGASVRAGDRDGRRTQESRDTSSIR